MQIARFTVAVVLTLSGCLFTGDEPDDDVVIVDNNQTNNTATNGATNSSNGGVEIGPADLTEIDCQPNDTLFVTDDGVAPGYEIDESTAIAFSDNLVKIGLADPGYRASVAWAKVVGGELRLVIGRKSQLPDQLAGETALDDYIIHKVPIAAGAEVFEVTLDATSVLRLAGEIPYRVHAATSEGVISCYFVLPEPTAQDLVPICNEGVQQIQSQLEAADVYAVQQFDFLPIMTPAGAVFTLELSALRLLFGGSGKTGERTVLGLVEIDEAGVGTRVSVAGAVDSSLPQSEVFAERLTFGVTEESAGWPILQVLARDPSGDDYRPRILVKGERGYVEQSIGSWPLPPGVEPSTANFVFLDGYDAEFAFSGTEANPRVEVDFARSEALYGYAALADGGTRLILSRPGGIAGSDMLETELTGAAELRVIRNLPFDRTLGTAALPVLVVVDGSRREKVDLMQWNFSSDVELLPDAFRGRFEDVTHLTRPTLESGGGKILAFRARSEGRFGIGLFPFGAGSTSGAPSGAFDANVCVDR